MRKLFCAAAAFVLTLTLAACSGEAREVPVERVDMLTAASFAEDRYAGIVVSENVTKITRDLDKTIENVYVTEGSEVKAGTKLFSYDSEALRLELDRQKLELEKMKNENTNYTSQLKDLNSQLSKTSDESVKAQLNLQIKTIENEQNQLKYDIEAKNREIEQLNTSLKNVTITSPVEGTVRKIDETDTTAYITIQQAGAYRIKGALQAGVVAGFPVVDVKVTLYDGSYHEVDSSEMAFKIAGSMAFKEAMRKADPVLLEPIMKVSVIVPDDYLGTVIGDLTARRGQILGQEARPGAQQVDALVPLANMFGYATDLRSSTQGRGQYTMEPHSYAELPKSIRDKIVETRTKPQA